MKLNKMEETISHQQLEILDQKQTNLEQEQKISAQEQQISSLESANCSCSDQQQMTTNVNSTLEGVRHIETGYIRCDSSEFYNGGTSSRYNTVSKTFNQRYSRPPVVF